MTETVAQDKGLNSKLLPELKAMAAGLGIDGASGMRKAELVNAIGAKQGGGRGNRSASRPAGAATKETVSEERAPREERASRASDGESEGSDRNDRGDYRYNNQN